MPFGVAEAVHPRVVVLAQRVQEVAVADLTEHRLKRDVRPLGREARGRRASQPRAAIQRVAALDVGVEEPRGALEPEPRPQASAAHRVDRLRRLGHALAVVAGLARAFAVPAPFGEPERRPRQVGVPPAQGVEQASGAGAWVLWIGGAALPVRPVPVRVGVHVDRAQSRPDVRRDPRAEVIAAGRGLGAGVGGLKRAGEHPHRRIARRCAVHKAAEHLGVERRRIVPRFIASFDRGERASAGGRTKVRGHRLRVGVGGAVRVVPGRHRRGRVHKLNRRVYAHAGVGPGAVFAVPVQPVLGLGARGFHVLVVGHVVGISDVPAQVVVVPRVAGHRGVQGRA